MLVRPLKAARRIPGSGQQHVHTRLRGLPDEAGFRSGQWVTATTPVGQLDSLPEITQALNEAEEQECWAVSD